MTTKRTPIRRNLRQRITPEMVELWRRLHEDPDEERRREYSRELRRLLGWKPWEPLLERVTCPEPPDYMRGNEHQQEGWRKVWELRRELEEFA